MIQNLAIELVDLIIPPHYILNLISIFISTDGGDFNRTTNVTTSLDFSGTTSSRNCIRIAVIDDSLCEADESFIVSLTENVHYVRVINTSTTIVIQDNDG